MSNVVPYCLSCRGPHWASECPLVTKPVTNKPIVTNIPVTNNVTNNEVTEDEVYRVLGWRKKNKEKYNAYQREYMRKKRGV
jgi:hypothetical protein